MAVRWSLRCLPIARSPLMHSRSFRRWLSADISGSFPPHALRWYLLGPSVDGRALIPLLPSHCTLSADTFLQVQKVELAGTRQYQRWLWCINVIFVVNKCTRRKTHYNSNHMKNMDDPEKGRWFVDLMKSRLLFLQQFFASLCQFFKGVHAILCTILKCYRSCLWIYVSLGKEYDAVMVQQPPILPCLPQ